MTSQSTHLPILGLLACLAAAAPAAVLIDNFGATTNDRYADDPAFFADAYDFSGVGRNTDQHWATMIGPNVFLSATHYHPAIGSTVSFFPGNDPAAPSVTRTVAGGQGLAGSDLWIGHFDVAVPASIHIYSYATAPINNLSDFNSILSGTYALPVGNSPTNTGYGASYLTNMAVGENRLDDFDWNVSEGSSTGDVVAIIRNEPGDAGFTYETYETLLQRGDSGSPLLIDAGGGALQVVGTAWAVGTIDLAEGTRDFTVYTYTGNYTSEINSYFAIHAIPEPSTALLFHAAVAVVVLRHRRAA